MQFSRSLKTPAEHLQMSLSANEKLLIKMTTQLKLNEEKNQWCGDDSNLIWMKASQVQARCLKHSFVWKFHFTSFHFQLFRRVRKEA